VLRACLVVPAIAQQSAVARRVSGVVRYADAAGGQPVAGIWVTLHRVGPDTAAAIDSVRSDARGRYTFRYAPRGDSAVYFASGLLGGVAYFTSPFRGVDVQGDDAQLIVHDTTSTGAPIYTRGRHVIVSGIDDSGRRSVVEVIELENTASRTRVAGARAPSWAIALPDAATDVRVEQGDVASEAIAARNGRVEVFAPIPPGLRQIAFSYAIGAARFPVTYAVPESTTILEVLIEDPAGRADGAALAPQAMATIQGRSFQRFMSRDVAPGAVFRVTAPRAAARSGGRTLAIVVGLAGIALLGALASLALRGGGLRAVGARVQPDRAEAIARQIAALDARFERRANPEPAERAEYIAQRETLKKALTDVLAERADRL
jgi:hypothetical protein